MDTAIPMSIPSMPNPATLPNPSTPWMMSPGVFQRVQSINTNDPYKKCEITNKDPEWPFIHSYFAIQPPENRHIGRVYCIHNGASTRQFEALIPSLEEEAKQPAFKPKWKQEEDFALRQKVNDRWKEMTAPYSPFIIQGSNQRKDKYTDVKILPLWHGTTAAICDSICKTGFTSFGKHALIQGGASPGQNTDIGYFGSGIYFTNSARYAADIYSDGNLLLAWVSMREPYPVVANCAYPSKPKDMKKLEGLGHYENYNAHHIPVISVNPANKKCAVYYPCTANQEAPLDEIVVFQKTQALARFWIELEVSLAKSPFSATETIGTLLDTILELLDHTEVQQNPGLSNLLISKSNILFSINVNTPLDPENLTFYQKITRLMDATGKVRFLVAQQLMIPQIASPLPLQHQPALAPSSPSIIPQSIALKKPAIAFGAEKWNKYFGNVGIEPPLPPNIENILNSSCPFWPDKKVRDTHLLFLVPATVDGKPLTLNSFQELIQKPKKGYKTQYKFYDSYVKNELGNQSTSSHWVLMTRDIIPGSRGKSYEDQKKLVATHAKNSGQPYELPKALDVTIGILIEHVQTATKLYSDNPFIYTRCQEKVGENRWPVAIGGFAAGGLDISTFSWKDRIFIGVGGSWKLHADSGHVFL